MNNRGGAGGFSHKAPMLSTDMRCYFNCNEAFKKDVDLRLHLKLRHRNENENDLRRAYQAAEEEISLVSSSASTYQCALCPKKFVNHNTFWCHVTKRAHQMDWHVYKEQYGSCEVESAPFECKICGRVIKYVRKSITDHLRLVHKINWALYVERIRKMREGQMPDKLPDIDMFTCKICSASVKYLTRSNHLKGVHKITESEYLELFQGDDSKDHWSKDVNNNDEAADYSVPAGKPILEQPRQNEYHPRPSHDDNEFSRSQASNNFRDSYPEQNTTTYDPRLQPTFDENVSNIRNNVMPYREDTSYKNSGTSPFLNPPNMNFTGDYEDEYDGDEN